MIHLYLIRHGHTEWSDSGKIAGFTDVNLSDKGRQAVSGLKHAMTDLAPVSFFSSDLNRAMQTLEILGGGNNATQDKRLRELNFGDWEGLSWQQVHQRDPDFLDQWSANWVDYAPPSGESFKQLAERSHEWFRELTATTDLSSDPASFIVAAHAGSIRALLCKILDLPLQCAFNFSIDYARVTLIHMLADGHHQCEFVNASSLHG